MPPQRRLGVVASLVGFAGAQFIYLLIFLFGRVYPREDLTWLLGPLGEDVIGPAQYEVTAQAEALTLERRARDTGLIENFEQQLGSPAFDAARVHPLIREFYERTATFSMDVWSRAYFPASLALWLLVKTISRQVNQLNFPLSPLDTSRGVSSEIIALREADGRLKYTGWMRSLPDGVVLFTGFYMTQVTPGAGPCVKVVFPMPQGNATVVLSPRVDEDGSLWLDSGGGHFGGAGFYRLQSARGGRLRVWYIKTLKEEFHLWADGDGFVRCDHHVRFLGFPVVTLHYKIFRATSRAD